MSPITRPDGAVVSDGEFDADVLRKNRSRPTTIGHMGLALLGAISETEPYVVWRVVVVVVVVVMVVVGRLDGTVHTSVSEVWSSLTGELIDRIVHALCHFKGPRNANVPDEHWHRLQASRHCKTNSIECQPLRIGHAAAATTRKRRPQLRYRDFELQRKPQNVLNMFTYMSNVRFLWRYGTITLETGNGLQRGLLLLHEQY